MRSAKLEDKICEIAGRIKGFNFGRFDIRTDSFEDISNGENFKIIELNGVTSESTNIYDPQFNLIDAYRILFKQWRIAFEIGTDNMILGAPPTKLSQLLSLAFTTGKRLRGTSIQCA